MLKLVDDLYNMYRHYLNGDDEDIDIIAFSVLEELDRDDLLDMIQEMKEQDLFDMVGHYLIEMLKGKKAQEGISRSKMNLEEDRTIH